MPQKTHDRTVIAAECRITGRLVSNHDALVLGRFRGDMKIHGSLELGSSANVAGTIVATHVKTAGLVTGDLIVAGLVELLPGARVLGRLYAAKLAVADDVMLQTSACVIGPGAAAAAQPLIDSLDARMRNEFADEAPPEAPEVVSPAETIVEAVEDNCLVELTTGSQMTEIEIVIPREALDAIEAMTHDAPETPPGILSDTGMETETQADPHPPKSPQIATIPNALLAVLHRRRPKVLIGAIRPPALSQG